MKHVSRGRPDLLHGTIADKLLYIALPLAATGILQQLFNAADVAVVGRFVGESAMAAVGSNAPVIGLLVNLFVGTSLGTNVLISQFIGQRSRGDIRRAVQTSVIFAVLGGLLFGLIGELAAPRLLSLLSVPEDVIGMATTYLRIYFLGLPVIFLYNFESAIFRAQGDTRTPLLVLTGSGVLNVGLNLLFVLGLGLDVEGVALATLASNLMSAVILFLLLSRSRSDVRLELRGLRVDTHMLKRILLIGVPAGIQSAVFSVANICIQSAINSLGTTVMAASSAAFNLEIFAYFVLNSFSQACTTFVGQNYGAGDIARCRRTLRITLLVDAAFTAAACLLILGFASPLLSVFNKNPDVIRYGTTRLRYIFASYAFSMLVDVFSGYLRGFGLSLVPAMTTLVGVVGVRIAWVYLVFPAHRTFAGLLTVYPISLAVTAAGVVVSWLALRRRRGI